jgi:phage terminase large subunit-like protein
MAIGGWDADRKRAETHLVKAAQWSLDQDSQLQGMRYKSEVLSCADLFKWFSGGREAQQILGLKGASTIEQADAAEELRLSKRIKVAKKDEKMAEVIPYTEKIFGKQCDFQEWLEYRDRARKDLFWLGTDILGRDLVPEVHQVICDQFVKKNFDGIYYDGYRIGDVHNAIASQERRDARGLPTREMMLLDPRGFYKSTIDGIDCVQWLLNAPDIRILILAGEFHLSVAFLSEIKTYFFLPKNADLKIMHLLFPEYILRGMAGESDQPLWCPARRHNQKEASLWTNAIFASLSGWHCDIRKGDDVVTDRNCTTAELRATLKEKYDGTDNLVDEWGMSDHIGTRYWVDDWYGRRIDAGRDGEPETALKYFCRQCWTVKPGFEKVALRDLTADMVTLTFPQKATFATLRRKLILNERSFRNQQLNEPLEDDFGVVVNFDIDMLRSHMYRIEIAPKIGDVYIVWDTALTSGKHSDFSCGAVARIFPKVVDGKTIYSLVILEVVYGRFTQSELAYQIVALGKKWNPKKTLIEKLPGSELFQREVHFRATQFGVSLDVYWCSPSLEPNAKRNRIHGLEILLKEDRLWFVAGSWIDETFSQLIKYTGEKKNRGRKDDIPDAMSYFTLWLPATVQNELMKALEKDALEKAKKKGEYDRIFGPSAPIFVPTTGSNTMNKAPDPRGAFGIPGLRPGGPR